MDRKPTIWKTAKMDAHPDHYQKSTQTYDQIARIRDLKKVKPWGFVFRLDKKE
jgi:hypothetical protein